jgi:meiotic recombination protein SPO11
LTTGSANTTAPLSSRDRRVAINIIQEICGNEILDVDEMEQRHELQLMLMLNVKAEMQAVDNSGDITDWLDRKLCSYE